jgi:hypothetical protein
MRLRPPNTASSLKHNPRVIDLGNATPECGKRKPRITDLGNTTPEHGKQNPFKLEAEANRSGKHNPLELIVLGNIAPE